MLKKIKNTKKVTEKSAATLTIIRPDEMSSRGRKEVAKWLRNQAAGLIKDGSRYDKRFIARYMYFPGVK